MLNPGHRQQMPVIIDRFVGIFDRARQAAQLCRCRNRLRAARRYKDMAQSRTAPTQYTIQPTAVQALSAMPWSDLNETVIDLG